MDLEKKLDKLMDLARAASSFTPLIPEDLEPILVDLSKRLAPLLKFVKVGEANGITHSFNQQITSSKAEFEGDLAVTRQRGFTTQRASVGLKILRAGDGVSHFAESATRKQIRLFKKAVMDATKGMGWAMEQAIVWGWGKDAAATKNGDIYAYGGLDQNVTTNLVDFVSAKVTLDLLDNLMDKVKVRGYVEMGQLLFIMSPRMLSVASGLYNNRYNVPLPKIDVAAGMRMESYRRIPILETSYCAPTATMGTVTAAKDATVGLLEAKTYKYKVSYINLDGEQAHCAEVTQAADADDSIKLSWTAITDAEVYKIYRTAGDGAGDTEKLLITIPAKTYDGNGTVTGTVASYVDGLADASIETQIPLTIADEVIFLVNTDPDNSIELESLMNDEGEKVNNLIQYTELGKTKSAKDFLMESFQALAVKGERYNSYARRVKLA